MQNGVNPAYIITMTHLELLQEQLQMSEEMHGSDAPVTRMIRQELEETKQELSSTSGTQKPNESPMSRTYLRNSNLLRYQAGLRKGTG
jgi:hypothetical protein